MIGRLETSLALLAFLTGIAFTSSASSAEWNRRQAPLNALPGAPAEFVRFTQAELSRGFLALAFGSDMRMGDKSQRIRRFVRPIRFFIAHRGSVDRKAEHRAVVEEFVRRVPQLAIVFADNSEAADVVVHLVDERQLVPAMTEAVGRQAARKFAAKADPQCVTRMQSGRDGVILHVDSFLVVDQGDEVFRNCAYHEMLHVFGLMSHADDNRWTALNQRRSVGYLSVYDRSMLALLYDDELRPGMNRKQVKRILPHLIRNLPQDERAN